MALFTQYTLSELRALVLRFLRQTDTSRYSPTAGTADYDWIDDSIDQGQLEFVRRTHCLRSFVILKLTADQRLYRLPSDFMDMMAAYYYDTSLTNGYRELSIKTIAELNDEISNWRTDTGTPRRIYIDRMSGDSVMCGLCPIPASDGGDITVDSNATILDSFDCTIYTYSEEFGTIVRPDGENQFILNTSNVVGKIATMDKDVLIEYYRLPQEVSNELQYPEVPREYHRALAYYAAYDLLAANPEDSIEAKRAMAFYELFERQIAIYINRRKRALSGRELRAKPAVWTWVGDMDWYKGLP